MTGLNGVATKPANIRGRFTAGEDALIRLHYETLSSADIGSLLGRSAAAIRNRCWALGIKGKVPFWSDEEVSELRRMYANPSRVLGMKAFCEKYGRDKSNVCRKAKELGLARDKKRPRVEERKIKAPMFATPEELSAHRSKSAKEQIARQGHPRGALGMKHSASAKKAISAAHQRLWADPSSKHNAPEAKQRRANQLVELRNEGKMRNGWRRKGQPTSAGRREDLGGMFLRSTWEANYARYLEFLRKQKKIRAWQYEAKRFVFEGITRGTQSYVPDFKVTNLDGSHEWHEVKGYMDPISKTRLDRMARYFPSEKVVVISTVWFRQAKRSGLAAAIPHWEVGLKK